MAAKALVKAQDTELVALSAELVSQWLAYERSHNGSSANTVVTYERGLDVFSRWLEAEGLSLATAEPADVASFREWLAQSYSVQTVNLRLTAVRRFYAFVVETGRALLNPAASVKGLKRRKSRLHKRGALTGGEVLSVLATCDTSTLEGLRDKAIIALMAYCALRQVEVYRANVDDVKTRGERLTLDVVGKGALEPDEYVIIPVAAEPIVRDWLRALHRESGAPLFVSLSRRSWGSRLALSSIRNMVKARFAGAGVVGDDKSTHSLRHSAITSAIRRGASPMQVQSMARHASFDTTLGYFHETSRLEAPAEDFIDYSNGN